MARTCFEVSKFVITFCCTKDQEGKTNVVSEAMKKYLKRYASNTGYKISSSICKGYNTDTVICVELLKSISLITMTTILSHMFGENIASISYLPLEKLLNLEILRWKLKKISGIPDIFFSFYETIHEEKMQYLQISTYIINKMWYNVSKKRMEDNYWT